MTEEQYLRLMAQKRQQNRLTNGMPCYNSQCQAAKNENTSYQSGYAENYDQTVRNGQKNWEW